MQRFHVSIGFDISVVVASYGSGTYHPFDFVVSSYLTKSAISSGRLVPTRDKINCTGGILFSPEKAVKEVSHVLKTTF